jgi:hypothetical protein
LVPPAKIFSPHKIKKDEDCRAIAACSSSFKKQICGLNPQPVIPQKSSNFEFGCQARCQNVLACNASNALPPFANAAWRSEAEMVLLDASLHCVQLRSVAANQIPRFSLVVSSCAWPTVRELLFEQFHYAVRPLAYGAEPCHPSGPERQRADPSPFYSSSGNQTLYLDDLKIKKRLDRT